jgi:hypothetical protein
MSVLINQKKVNGGIISTAGRNVTLWYTRQQSDKFNINGSFNGLETPNDWVLIKSTDSNTIGVVSVNEIADTYFTYHVDACTDILKDSTTWLDGGSLFSPLQYLIIGE